MKRYYNGELVEKAREMRKNATHAENRLWYCFLKDHPIRFRRQRPLNGFVADFYCAKAKLIIELDGEQHHTAQGRAYDIERSAVLDEIGFEVIRFSNHEVEQCFDQVCNIIEEKVIERIKVLNA